MNVTRVKKSKINSVDFKNIVFGKIFTDHMFYCNYRDGKWQTPEITPYKPLTLDPSSSVLHYGQAVFEGMKAFKDNNGLLWLFRPEENFKRINLSAKRLQIPEFPESFFFKGLKSLLKLDQDWVKPGTENSLYIRPFVFASQPSVQASVLIAEEYSRAASGGVGFAKAAGNYAAQFYPTSEALKKGFQQIIWTDSNNHEYLEEAGTMNIFFKIDGTLVTSPTNDRILDGITRKSIIAIAKNDGIQVEERPIKVSELKKAHDDGLLEEIFGTGTAVVVLPIHGFSHQGKSYSLSLETPLALQLKEKLVGIQYNSHEDPFNWRQAVD